MVLFLINYKLLVFNFYFFFSVVREMCKLFVIVKFNIFFLKIKNFDNCVKVEDCIKKKKSN